MSRERKRLYYSGDVQGVGFRARTASIALGYEVDGWVRNLWDGRVELVVEGNGGVVEQFLSRIRTAFVSNIVDTEVFLEPASLPMGSGFSIRRG